MQHRSRVCLSLLVALLAWAFINDSGWAADFRGAEAVTVPTGEVLRDNLYAAGNTVTIDGTVEGDVFAAAQTVTIRGRVSGSLITAAEYVNVTGSVDGSVRAVAKELRVERRIGGDLMALAQSVSLTPEGSVALDALVLGQNVGLEGPVSRSFRGAGEEIRLNGSIGGAVEIFAVENLVLGPRARIDGDLSYESTREMGRESGAEVRGRITRRDPPPERHPEPADRLGGIVFGILAVTVMGAAALALAPTQTSAAAMAVVHQSLFSLGLGFGLLIGLPLTAILLFFTLIGIPLALVVLVLYFVLLYCSQAIVALGLGRLLLSQLRPIQGYGWSVLAVLVGSLIIGALRSLPVVDGITTLMVLVLGLGSLGVVYIESRSNLVGNSAPQALSV